jgi:L-alanine-DL-glutamate epimerase-like enolase superfamily enzyme
LQIVRSEVLPIELKTKTAVRMAGVREIHRVTALFVRLETNDRRNAWGCAVAHPLLTGETPEHALDACQACADMACDLHPVNVEYSLAELAEVSKDSPAARCAFDLAFYDLLGLVTDMPLFRLLGGYRNKIQTSVTVPISDLHDTLSSARAYAREGFRMLKIKGGLDPEADVERVKAVHQALPNHILRLDADGAYSLRQALDVARALEDDLEMLEQPTSPEDLEGLSQVTQHSPVAVLADQSVTDADSALRLATRRIVDGMSLKMATCGGFSCARQIDAIARAAQMATMVSCVIEPALLIAAGLSFALSSPNVRYCDLDGHLNLVSDPTFAGFRLDEGWLVASDVPGLGCTVYFD